MYLNLFISLSLKISTFIALNSSQSNHNLDEETVSSGLLIFRPNLSNESSNSKNKIDMKIKYFVTQWLGDQVVVQESDLSFVREEKESKIEMYKIMLHQLSRIPITKIIFEIEKSEKSWKKISYTKIPPKIKKKLYYLFVLCQFKTKSLLQDARISGWKTPCLPTFTTTRQGLQGQR